MSLRIEEEEILITRKSFELKQEDKWSTVKSLGAICQGRYGHTAIRVANQWIIFGGFFFVNLIFSKEEDLMVI